MTPERWERVKDLCQRALERQPRDRGAFLAEVCLGNHELQRNVEALLMQATEGEGILEGPVWQKLGTAPAPTLVRPGAPAAQRLPRPSPVIAFCASSVKEEWGRLRSGTGPSSPRRRPESHQARPDRSGAAPPLRAVNRKCSGRLQHPGIAQIYEAGTADTGFGPQPYFAMEFIRGQRSRSTPRHRGSTHASGWS